MKTEKKPIVFSGRFVPQFWNEADGRSAIVKEIRRRVDVLKEDTGADSAQKQILCERAVFLALQLETMECTATDNGKIDLGVYTQATNALLGLLKALGLNKHQTIYNLTAYVAKGGERDEHH